MPEPWETPKGVACIDKWIATAMAKLNKHAGSPGFNARKPWSINQYGAVVGGGISSAGAPDNFPHFNNNKYYWMWAHYKATEPSEWTAAEWRAAAIPPLQSFVLACIEKP
jgi:hypothetical protein